MLVSCNAATFLLSSLVVEERRNMPNIQSSSPARVILQNPMFKALPPKRRILLVDDNELIRESLGIVLEHNDFQVVKAANVPHALQLIGSESFDVLLTDLQMPEAGDGLAVASAMRHTQPQAVTIIFSGYPEMRAAASAILLQTNQILVTPMGVEMLVATIKEQLRETSPLPQAVESVADILERETNATISDWLLRVGLEPSLGAVTLSLEDRYAHLPQMFRDLVVRLRHPLPLGTHAFLSASAADHGLLRRRQGYTAHMVVEESRMLQASIFQTLQKNLRRVDFSLLLLGVMAIADEVDSQLAQTVKGYMMEAKIDDLPLDS